MKEGKLPILGMSARMDNAIHVEIQIVKFDAVRIRLTGVDGYFLVRERVLSAFLFGALNHYGRVFTR